MADPLDTLKAALADRYAIERELGERHGNRSHGMTDQTGRTKEPIP